MVGVNCPCDKNQGPFRTTKGEIQEVGLSRALDMVACFSQSCFYELLKHETQPRSEAELPYIAPLGLHYCSSPEAL